MYVFYKVLTVTYFQRAEKETDTMSHMIQLLGEWTRLFPYDFRDERMMAHVRTITEKCVSADSEVVSN